MKLLKWIFFCGLYLAAGWFLPWWAPALVGFTLGFIRLSDSFQGLEQGLCAAIAAFLPALIFDIEAKGHISLSISGLFGVQFHPLGYLVSLCVAGILGGLSASFGATLREVLRQFRGGHVGPEQVEDRREDSRGDVGTGFQSADAHRSHGQSGP